MSKVNKSNGSKAAKSGGGEMSSDELLKMQESEQKKSERVTMLTNILAMRHQRMMAIINNFKA